jgi:hypothetical protein
MTPLWAAEPGKAKTKALSARFGERGLGVGAAGDVPPQEREEAEREDRAGDPGLPPSEPGIRDGFSDRN